MNLLRMKDRNMGFTDPVRATIPGHRLVFNKISAEHPGESHANLVVDPDCVSEGVLYKLVDEDEIKRMDPFENYPVNYRREVLSLPGLPDFWVYFANPEVCKEGLRPSFKYMHHLLMGKPFLSESYFSSLLSVRCIE